MYLRRLLIIIMLLSLPYSLVFATPSTTTRRPSFESAEHITAGNNILLFFSSSEPGKIAERLHLPNGVGLTYGEILSLGDFYAASGPISEGQTEAERRDRFLIAFNSFATSSTVVPEISKILDVAHQEQTALIDGAKNGKNPEEVYKAISGEMNRQYNCVTGGGCTSTWYLFPGRYLTLATRDVDHFGASAWLTYQTGHTLALELAIKAHQTNDVSLLQEAYAMNAFASHFLSDRFSAGHIRTPRVQLRQRVTPDFVGSLLGKFMHDEENHYGVYVHDSLGAEWLAFGDKRYFTNDSLETRIKMQRALQTSADEVFAAYIQGTAPKNSLVAQLIPYADVDNAKNITPLFFWDDQSQTLLRREDVTNVNDHHLTANWWGWSTFVMLSQQRGLPTEAQGNLVLHGLSQQAIAEGLITDHKLLEYIHTR